MDKYIYCCNTIAFFFLLKRGKIPGIKLLTAEKWHQWDKALFFSPLLHIYMFVIRQGKTCVSTLNHSLMLVVSVRITFPSFAFQLTCYSFFHPLCLHSDSSLNRFFFLSCKLVTNGIDNLKKQMLFSYQTTSMTFSIRSIIMHKPLLLFFYERFPAESKLW